MLQYDAPDEEDAHGCPLHAFVTFVPATGGILVIGSLAGLATHNLSISA